MDRHTDRSQKGGRDLSFEPEDEEEKKKRRKISYLEMENEQDLLIFPWGTNVSRLGDLTAPQTTTGRQWSQDQRDTRKWHSLSLAARSHVGTRTRSWTRNLPAGGASVGPAHAAGGRGGVLNCRSTVNAITRKQTEPPRPCWNIRGATDSPRGGNLDETFWIEQFTLLRFLERTL